MGKHAALALPDRLDWALVKAKPAFHIAPPNGWINDPNGPILFKGIYHMFYQYVPTGCTWAWGLAWGHAISTDCVTWEHMPPALVPTPGGYDQDGCFSGCATVDTNGVPTILYTGVRLRASPTCGPMPPPECDTIGTAAVETQCMAVGDPDDPRLEHWTKLELPFLATPPANMRLVAWRDPYIVGRPGENGCDHWAVMIGAGVQETAGSAMLYTAPTLDSPWTYTGEVTRGDGCTGIIWECPLMLRIPRYQEPRPLPAPSPTHQLVSQLTGSSPDSTPSLTGGGGPHADAEAMGGSSSQTRSVKSHLLMSEGRAAAFTSSDANGPDASDPDEITSCSPASVVKPIAGHPVDAWAVGAEDAKKASGTDLVAAGRDPAVTVTAVTSSPPCSSHGSCPTSPIASPSKEGKPAKPAASLQDAAAHSQVQSQSQIPSPQRVGPFASPRSLLRSPLRAPLDAPLLSSPMRSSPGRSPLCSPRLSLQLPATTVTNGNGNGSGNGALGGRRLSAAGLLGEAFGSLSLAGFGSHSNLAEQQTQAAANITGGEEDLVKALPVAGVKAFGANSATTAVRSTRPTRPLPCAPTPPPQRTAGAGDGSGTPSVACVGTKYDAPVGVPLPWTSYRDFFCVCPDDCSKMTVYYLGTTQDKTCKFDLPNALGPYLLDLGDIFYAPNTLADTQHGRVLLWGWLQEKPRKVGEYSYAGCLSLPRVLTQQVLEEGAGVPAADPRVSQALKEPAAAAVDGGQGSTDNDSGSVSMQHDGVTATTQVFLHQAPLPELASLRVPGASWVSPSNGVHVLPGQPQAIPQVAGPFLEFRVTMKQGKVEVTHGSGSGGSCKQLGLDGRLIQEGSWGSSTAAPEGDGTGACDTDCICSGLMLHSWQAGAYGSAAVLYHWDSGVLEVVFEALHPDTLTYSLDAPGVRRVGGKLLRPPAPGQPLSLHIFVDYSVLEVFTEHGEVLTTRVYRGTAPPVVPSHSHLAHSWNGAGSLYGSLAQSPGWGQRSMQAMQSVQSPGRSQQQPFPLQSPRRQSPPSPPLSGGPASMHAVQQSQMQDALASGTAAGSMQDACGHVVGCVPHGIGGEVAPSGVELLSFGGDAWFSHVEAHELMPIWQ